MSAIGNLTLTATNSAMAANLGMLYDTLQSRIANAGRDSNCRFYYSDDGASLLQVVAKKIIGGAVSELKDMVVNEFNSLLNGKKKTEEATPDWLKDRITAEKAEKNKYGKIEVDGGTVYAFDDWGLICYDALMLSMPISKSKPIAITQRGWMPPKTENGNSTMDYNIISSFNLVWYDTTAMITVNSDKNLVITNIQGRDHSRKELISNGDIKFSVTGHITSKDPDIYPTQEIKKFIQLMKYKGAIKINNQILDQFNIDRILITDYSLSANEGYKAVQNYTFNAIGLQPAEELTPENDTIKIFNSTMLEVPKSNSEDAWAEMFNNQLENLKSMAGGLVNQGLGLATGLLDNVL